MLTRYDLQTMREDGEFEGFGYLGHQCREPDSFASLKDAYAYVRDQDDEVVEAANELKWSRDELFSWANSRDGRYCGDALVSNVGAFRAIIRRSMREFAKFEGK